MGSISSKLFGNKEMFIVMIGLDFAGKTSLLYRFILGKLINPTPTIGFNREDFTYNGTDLYFYEIGGLEKVRGLWGEYINHPNTFRGGTNPHVIFVVDSTARDRMDEARFELHRSVNRPATKDSIILIFANKQDQTNAMKCDEIEEVLEVSKFKNRVWKLQPTSAVTGAGIEDGFMWLTSTFKKR